MVIPGYGDITLPKGCFERCALKDLWSCVSFHDELIVGSLWLQNGRLNIRILEVRVNHSQQSAVTDFYFFNPTHKKLFYMAVPAQSQPCTTNQKYSTLLCSFITRDTNPYMQREFTLSCVFSLIAAKQLNKLKHFAHKKERKKIGGAVVASFHKLQHHVLFTYMHFKL